MRNSIALPSALALLVLCCAVAPQGIQAQCRSGAVCTCPACPTVDRTYRHGGWFVLETANFQVCCQHSFEPARHVARHAETLRGTLQSKWLGKEAAENWSPRCQIVLHPNRQSYVAAVGRGSERTVGSSLIKVDGDRVTKRVIDLLGDSSDYLTAALPHELTHVVLKDRFAGATLPRWADEGMALLADTDAKQDRHNRDLQDALSRRTTFHAAELLTMDEYPSPNRFGAFYGQSAALTKFLVDRNNHEHFVMFLDRARETGYDAALAECYGIENIAALDRQWRQHEQSILLASFDSATVMNDDDRKQDPGATPASR